MTKIDLTTKIIAGRIQRHSSFTLVNGTRENILRGAKISCQKKLEGLGLMNELVDKVLTKEQKAKRRKLGEAGNEKY